MIKIEIAHPVFGGHFDLRSGDVVFVPVYNRPHRLRAQWPAACKDPEAQGRSKWLPRRADKKTRHRTFEGGYPASRLGIARGKTIPDSPDVLPGLPPHSVTKRQLQVVRFIAFPAVGDV